MQNFTTITNFIWSIADLLRGTYKQSDYGKVILPFTVLTRLDSVLVSTKQNVLEEYERSKGQINEDGLEHVLKSSTKNTFFNTSKFTVSDLSEIDPEDKKNLNYGSLKNDPNNLLANLKNYINCFSSEAREIMMDFNFFTQLDLLDKSGLLFQIYQEFANKAKINLHPGLVSNVEMGYVFEELIRKFSELSNETAGEHFTPREVIKLMVNLLFMEDTTELSKSRVIKTLYDPACGTGGMLSVAESYLREMNPELELVVYGQEINRESYAICKSDMMIKGQRPENIKRENTFTNDLHTEKEFDYMLCNPPFGVDWKAYKKKVEDEHKTSGFSGRFGAGTPRVSDGSLLFLQHKLSKMKQNSTGTRLAIIFNGSPLFSGSAGSGESEIRKWIIENDWLEAIIALPEQLFYNTGIFTYIWVLSNKKSRIRKGKIQLVNAISFYEKMKKSLGNKRNIQSETQIQEITQIYGEFKNSKHSKIFENEDFGYRELTIERPLQLNWQLSEDRIQRLWGERGFIELAESKKKHEAKKLEVSNGQKLQRKIIKTLNYLSSKNSSVHYYNADIQNLIITELGTIIDKRLVTAILNAIKEHDPKAPIIKSGNKPKADANLRDKEIIPLNTDINEYFKSEVLPYVPDAWIDEKKIKIGYEIPFTKNFFEYKSQRNLNEIDNEIKSLHKEISNLLRELN